MESAEDSGVGGVVTSEGIGRILQDTGLDPLTEEALARFERYLALLLRWNSKLNLTAVREPEAIIQRHFVECVQCAQELPAEIGVGALLLDFGSGAGLPGIPIAICRPEIRVVFAESQGKKAAFLREAVRTLGLSAEVFDGRVEEMPEGRQFSAVTLRAVDKMTEACQLAAARVAPGGWLILFATKLTAAGILSALPRLRWEKKVATLGLDQGVLLFGRMA